MFMAKTAIGDMGGDDWGKWLGVLGLLGAAGLLPPQWRRAVGVAAAVYTVWSLLQ